MRNRSRAALLCAAVLSVLIVPPAALPSYGAAPTAQPTAAATPSVAAPDTVRLDAPAHGREAVRELGDDLDVAAARNGMTAAGLRDLLLSDRTAWVDETGKVLYVEPTTDPAARANDLPVVATIDPADAFTLHSKPDSQHVLFLDFDGSTVSGTAWNSSYSVTAGAHPAWTLDGDSSTFSTTERNAITSIWARVAEDYAPFDVDVTTVDPGPAAISRTNDSDPTYGTRVLVSPSADAYSKICPGGCGGVAYIDVFDMWGSNHDYYQPAWVFPQGLGNGTKAIAEAASHEAGHNFGLNHDGTASVGYYSGHANWAPIMGVGYYKPLVQWSKGDYAGANNTGQDDVAIIAAGGAPYRTDEAGGTVGGAAALTSATTYIATRDDVDVWSVGTCSGAVTVSANPAATSPNLDISLALLNGSGGVVAVANPASGNGDGDTASGLSAGISTSVPAATYYVQVDGVGNGSWAGSTGYDDYASIGAYTVTTTGCSGGGVAPTAPGAPTGLTVVPADDGQSATFSWSPPASNGGSAITGYTVGRSGAATQDVGAATTSVLLTGLTPGQSYTFTARATNAVGPSADAAITRTMPVPASVPGAPQNLSVALETNGTTAWVAWDQPATDGGSPLLGYEVLLDGVLVGSDAQAKEIALTGLDYSTTYEVSVRARNAVGYSPAASEEFTSGAAPPPPATAPSAPRIGKATSGRKGGRSTARIAWGAPASAGGLAVDGYLVHAFLIKDGRVVRTTTSAVQPATKRSLTMRLPPGRYQFAVVARNPLGSSPASANSRTVRAR